MAATVESNRVDNIEKQVGNLESEVGKLKGAYEHLATGKDVSDAVLKLVLCIVGVGVVSLSALISILLNILSRFPS